MNPLSFSSSEHFNIPSDIYKWEDMAEKVVVRPLAALKIIKHCLGNRNREVVGVLMGSFLDVLTVYVDDAFPMPMIDHGDLSNFMNRAYRKQMVQLRNRVGCREIVIGWYHTHPGQGICPTVEDAGMQQQFEVNNPRSILILLDPIGNSTTMKAYRLVNAATILLGAESRQVTSNMGSIMLSTNKSSKIGMNRRFNNLELEYSAGKFEQFIAEIFATPLHKTLNVVNSKKFEMENERICRRLADLIAKRNQELIESLDTEKPAPSGRNSKARGKTTLLALESAYSDLLTYNMNQMSMHSLLIMIWSAVPTVEPWCVANASKHSRDGTNNAEDEVRSSELRWLFKK